MRSNAGIRRLVETSRVVDPHFFDKVTIDVMRFDYDCLGADVREIPTY